MCHLASSTLQAGEPKQAREGRLAPAAAPVAAPAGACSASASSASPSSTASLSSPGPSTVSCCSCASKSPSTRGSDQEAAGASTAEADAPAGATATPPPPPLLLLPPPGRVARGCGTSLNATTVGTAATVPRARAAASFRREACCGMGQPPSALRLPQGREVAAEWDGNCNWIIFSLTLRTEHPAVRELPGEPVLAELSQPELEFSSHSHRPKLRQGVGQPNPCHSPQHLLLLDFLGVRCLQASHQRAPPLAALDRRGAAAAPTAALCCGGGRRLWRPAA